MFEKRFAGTLICLVLALSFSNTAVMGGNILFISAMDDAADPGGVDDVLKVFMEGLGHTVTYFDDDESEADMEIAAAEADLVFISESVNSSGIREKITEIETPMIITEPWAWDEMGLTLDSGGGDEVTTTDIEIVGPEHFLAADLSGTVTVLTNLTGELGDARFGKGIAGNDATVIATAALVDGQTYDVIYIYEKGATLPVAPSDGSPAVAADIRICFGFDERSYPVWNENAYMLLEAAINYALGTVKTGHIIVVNEAHDYDQDGVQDDQGLVDWLESEGHSVDVRHDHWMELDAGKIDDLNAADLIIVSRTSNSARYDEGEEPTQWNSATTPLILMQALIARSNRWKWINSSSQINFGGAPALKVVEPGHPIFAGVALSEDNLVQVVDPNIGSGHTSSINADNVGNGTLLAREAGTELPWIAEWEAGVEFYDGAGQIPADKRLMLFAGTRESDGPPPTPWGAWNFTVKGEIIFRNAINYMIGGTVDPRAAWGPSPRDDATVDRAEAIPLSWKAGETAARHDVYFGTNFTDVYNADTSDTTGIYRDRQNLLIYTPPETLELGQSYYWRIDEVEADNTTIIKGKVWSFIIAELLTLDDFENYDAGDNQIWFAWHDGFGYGEPGAAPYKPGNGTGSEIGDVSTDSYTEEIIVHSGKQSMPYLYDNNKQGYVKYSEATKTLTETRDWTEQGLNTLSLWFRGHPAYMGGFVEEPAGTYTITGGGADIWDNSDQFHFAWQELSGAGEIIAKVESVENTNDWAKAGIMIRDSLDPDSVFAMVAVTPGNGVWFGRRTLDGTASDAQADITTPQWVKIERTIGGLVRAYYSADGSSWTQLGSPIPTGMYTPMYIGLAVTSHNPGVACEAIFSNVTSNGVGPWTDQDIGLTSNEAAQMYVEIANNNGTTGIVYHDDPDATLINSWMEWNIDMKDFSGQGIDLTDVNSISIGFGDKGNPQAGGSGKMFIDDIRLYVSRLEPEP